MCAWKMNCRHSKLLLFFFMALLLISVALAAIVLWAWSHTINYFAGALKGASRETQAFLLQTVCTQVKMFRVINTSTVNLANILTSTVKGDLSSFHTVEKQVAPALFLAYSAVPYLSQALYIGNNGLVFSYYRELNQTRAIFSNSSWYFGVGNSTNGNVFNHSSKYHWYGEIVDGRTGILQGKSVDISQLLPFHSYWIQKALQHNGQSMMIGPKLASDGKQSFLFIAPIVGNSSNQHRGIIALGVSVDQFMSYYTSDTGIQNLGIYLATKDGKIWAKSDLSSAYSLPIDHSILQEASRRICDLGNSTSLIADPSNLEINGAVYMIHCVQLNTAGNPLVLLISFSQKDILWHVHGMSVIILVALAVMLIISGFVNSATYLLARRYQKNTSFLHASLIKCKEALQQAERKSMNKSLAFTSASHDIRTSLAGISGLIELCRSYTSQCLDLHTYLEQMNTCASHLLAIVNSILDTSKIEAGKMQLEEAEFDMSMVLEESVDIFHIVALNKGLELIWDPCDFSVLSSSTVKGDCQRFRQILDNLLGNAVKFTPQGHIILRAWAKKRDFEGSVCPSNSTCQISNIWNPLGKLFDANDSIYGELGSTNDGTDYIEFVFEVDDSGIGIPKEKRASVFENYVQVKESTACGDVVGTGLGLGIVQSYVRLMGGEINIVDKDMNEKGTCFRFNVFLKQVEPPINIEMDRSLCYNRLLDKLHRLHVLHFIQGVQTRKILQRWMENFGAKVLEIDGIELFNHSVEKIKYGLADGHFYHQEKNDPMPPKVLFERTASCVTHGEDARGSSPTKEEFEHKFSFKRTRSKVSSTDVLIIVDMPYQPLSELTSILSNFVKGANRNHCKIVWLRDSKAPLTEIRRLTDRDRLCDLILEKPFHGSRIYKVLKLLQGFKRTSFEEAKSTASTRLLPRGKCHEHVGSIGTLVCDKPLIGWNILIAEDNHVMRLLASSMISSLGATIQVAENGEVAVKLVREALNELIVDGGAEADRIQRRAKNFLYDLILMDCMMPKMDGYEAAKQIRMEEQHYDLHIPIVALSAHEEKEKGHISINAGMDLHVSKPLSKELLLDAIQTLNITKDK